ncbi:MAG: FtsK/SpoIIIE domain-containing protein, partial [Candidatus Anstonellales archaeon]
YVLSILMSLMMFNTPEEVQFILVDPKESNLFKTLSLMPHVAGLHNDSNILDVMRDLIENEAPRRKKLLADNRCDDIWALWEKGIKIPVLYLVIDEVITVKNNLGNLDKEFDSLMQTIITQFPSLGIRLIFVPHRAMGVVNKTNRTMISFTAAVRSNTDDIKDTLGIQKWTRALVNKGDVAVKSSNMNNAMYVRGAALSISDNHNTELIENIAKAFYKMGVDLPDMSSLTVAYNRNEDEIRDILSSSGRRVQYNALNIFNDVEDIE